MDFEYYSGSKEKDRLRRCMEILGKTEARVDRYDNIEDTLHITLERSWCAQEDAMKIQKAFRKAGYLDLKVCYKTGATEWRTSDDARVYYNSQYNKTLKNECLEPLVLTFLNQYLNINNDYDKARRSVNAISDATFTVQQVRENLSEVYQRFDVNEGSKENWLIFFVMAILHASGLIGYNVIIRFCPLHQDVEMVFSISEFIADGGINQSLEKFISRLSKNEKKKVISMTDWEVEHINEYISTEVKAKIRERLRTLFLI